MNRQDKLKLDKKVEKEVVEKPKLHIWIQEDESWETNGKEVLDKVEFLEENKDLY
jgi:hypothetical protein